MSISPFGQGGPIALNQHRLSRLLILLTGALLLAPAMGYCMTMNPADPCQGNPTAGPCTGVDDDNTAHVFPLVPIIKQANLINFGMSAFVSSHPGWSYSWASQTDIATVEKGISILDYYAWVVTEPDPATSAPPTDPDYHLGIDPILQNNGNFNDVGGAVFSLSYTPVAGAPVIADLHWVQAVGGSLYGQRIKSLDNDSDPDSPFYDTNFSAGDLPNGGGWFFDRPWQLEQEYEDNPVTHQNFQVALASYDANTDTVILYGGYNWGYRYTAEENPPFSTPEAGNTLVLLFVGAIGVTMLSRIKGFHPEFCPARKGKILLCNDLISRSRVSRLVCQRGLLSPEPDAE
jgi:hypothetical protein